MSHPTSAAAERPFFSNGTLVLLAVMGVGYAFGFARMFTGLGPVTNLTTAYPWGIWIAIDVACGVALAAGGFTTAALVEIFGRGKYHALVRPAILTAWLGYTFVGVGLFFDLGRYWNIWRPLIHWQGNSVLFEVGMCVMAYLTVLTVEMLPALLEGLLARAERNGWDARFIKPFQRPLIILRRTVRTILPLFVIAGVVLSCMHQSSLGTLMVIAPTKLSPWWYTPWGPALFLLSAISVGFPMVILEGMVAAKSFKRPLEMDLFSTLARITPVILAIYAVFKVVTLLGNADQLSISQHPMDAVAWAVEFGFGVVIPFFMLLFSGVRKSPRWLLIACLLVIGGVVLNRINVFLVGFHPPFDKIGYFPAIGEIAVTAGLIATIMVLYRFVANYFPILEEHHEDDDEADSVRDPGMPGMIGIAVRALAVVFLVGFVAFYVFVHYKSERFEVYQHLDISRPEQAWPKAAQEPHTQRPEKYKNVFMIDQKINNERVNDYEPVRFTHSSHDTWTDGNCAVCHHRYASEDGDRVGKDLAAMHVEYEAELGGACASCHEDMSELQVQSCVRCHGRPNEQDHPARPGLKAAYHRQCMDCHRKSNTKSAPLDCNACHHPNTPDHAPLIGVKGKVRPEEMTGRCLDCHADSARDVMASNHWRCEGNSPNTVGHQHRSDLGKCKLVDSYMLHVGGNEAGCVGCHAGYGLVKHEINPVSADNIDCLVCHDTTGTYKKDPTQEGRPAEGVDLVAVAKAVGRPAPANCGVCHFNACSGANARQGDLGPELAKASPEQDVHLGKYKLRCQDCHKTEHHRIAGQSIQVPASEGRAGCEQCHGTRPHAITGQKGHHLNNHIEHIACQTCHVPYLATDSPTVVAWDWSTAGKAPASLEPGQKFDKKLGTRTWASQVVPTYAWYNGTHARYLLGDKIEDLDAEVALNRPVGTRSDPHALIAPFKIETANQPADAEQSILAFPKLAGSLWEHFDWNKALTDGMQAAGLKYSGNLAWVKTRMYSGVNHGVAGAKSALGCTDCHAPEAISCSRCHSRVNDLDVTDLVQATHAKDGKRLDFKALGYEQDPALSGGRFQRLPFGKSP